MRGWGPVAIVIMLASACGQETRHDPLAAASDPVPAAASETAVAASPSTGPVDSDGPEIFGPSLTLAEVQTDEGEPMPTTATIDMPLIGLMLDDPLPAQPDAQTDAVGAEVAVRFAYEHWLLVDLDAELRGHLMEGGEEHAAAMDDGMKRQRSGLEGATIGVESITFIDADHADVSFQVYWYGNPSPYFPEPRTGGAVLQQGSWRVTGSTVCVLALGAGFGCPLQDAGLDPEPPQALRLIAVPAGLVWLGGPGPADVVGLGPNHDDWQGSDTDTWMSIWFNPRPGVAQLSADDADALLLAYAGGSGSVAVTVGGRPARYFRSDGYRDDGSTIDLFLLVQIRADDVIVQADASNVPIDQVIAAVESLTPVEAS
jgi:hypothetical protein